MPDKQRTGCKTVARLPLHRGPKFVQRRTAAILERPHCMPASRKEVLPLMLPVTRPPWRRMRSSASPLRRESMTPVTTNVLLVRQSGCPRGASCTPTAPTDPPALMSGIYGLRHVFIVPHFKHFPKCRHFYANTTLCVPSTPLGYDTEI